MWLRVGGNFSWGYISRVRAIWWVGVGEIEGRLIERLVNIEYTCKIKTWKSWLFVFFHVLCCIFKMISQKKKDTIAELMQQYEVLKKTHLQALHTIAMNEVAEMVYNSNAIENSTLTLKDTEDILVYKKIRKDHDIREVYEAKNLATITTQLLESPDTALSIEMILSLHKTLLTGISDDRAGRFRQWDEWVQVWTHMWANPTFIHELMYELVDTYHASSDYFLEKIACFHAEFECLHPFGDGNGRIGRVLINQQLMVLWYPPIIIPHKSKKADYYPLFEKHDTKSTYDGFVKMFTRYLMESLHKRITLLTVKKIITVNQRAKLHGKNVRASLNKAKRQTIPAFRLREKWMIAEEWSEE